MRESGDFIITSQDVEEIKNVLLVELERRNS
jgi:hypothetical protein